MVTYGGEQSLDRYLALSARGLPFNVVHAAGNFAIALAAGPALVRMISRFRTRLEFTWRPRRRPAPGRRRAGRARRCREHPRRPRDARRSGVDWLVGAQNDDGGFAATRGQPSGPAITGWAMLGLEAAGRNPHDVRSGARTPVTYLRSQVGRLRSTGDLERTILALVGAGHRSAPLRRHRPDRRAALAPRPRRLGRRPGQPDRLLRAGACAPPAPTPHRSGAPRAGCGARRALRGAGESSPPRRRRRTRPAPRSRAWSRPGRAVARPPAAPPGCAKPSAAAGAGRWARAESSTRSRPPGRSRAWSPPAPPQHRRSPTGSATWRGCERPTATTATRRPATRPRSGSPPRSCSRSSASRSRSRPSPAPRPAPAPRARATGRARARGRRVRGADHGRERLARRTRRRRRSRAGRRRRHRRRRSGRLAADRGRRRSRRAGIAVRGAGERRTGLCRRRPGGSGGRRGDARGQPLLSGRRGGRRRRCDLVPARRRRRAGRCRRRRLALVAAPVALSGGRRISPSTAASVVADGCRDRDPHPAHPQGLPARAARPRRPSTSCSTSPAGLPTTT